MCDAGPEVALMGGMLPAGTSAVAVKCHRNAADCFERMTALHFTLAPSLCHDVCLPRMNPSSAIQVECHQQPHLTHQRRRQG